MTIDFKGNSHKQLWPLIGGFVGLLVLSVLLLQVSLLIQIPWGADTISHFNWNRVLSGQLAHELAYHRWIYDYNNGLGSPDYFFYPPFSAYITVFIDFLLSSISIPSIGLKVSSVLALFLSGVSAFYWLSHSVRRGAALVGAAIYMLLPYHLAIDYYQRVAFAEFWAFVWLPLLFHAAQGIANRRPKSGIVLALAYCGLIITHLPTTLYLSLFLPFVTLVFAPRSEITAAFLRVCGFMILGIALSGVYLIPALTMLDYVHIETMFGDPTLRLFTFPPRLGDIKTTGIFTNKFLREYIAAGTTVALSAFLYFDVRSTQAASTRRFAAKVWLGFLLAGLFLTLAISKPIWETTMLAKIQYPQRILGMVTLCAAALVALWMEGFFDGTSKLRIPGVVGIALLGAYWAIDAAYLGYHLASYDTERFHKAADSRLYNEEYYPIWVDNNANKKYVEMPAFEVQVIEGSGSAHLVLAGQHELRAETQTSTGMVVNLPRLYFPIWTAVDASSGRPLDIKPSEPQGLIQVTIPAGVEAIQVARVLNIREVIGSIVSMLGLIVLIFFLAKPKNHAAS
jgi:hypothetical protein